MKIAETSDDELVYAAMHGDIHAFELLYLKYAPGVFALAMKIMHNTADAQDVQQETFVVVLTKIHLFDSQSGIYAWMSTVAKRLCYKMLRMNTPKDYRRFYAYPESLHVCDPYQTLWDFSIPSYVEIRLATLPEQQRHTVDCRYHGMSFHDIGLRLGCTENTARVHMYFGLKKLQDYFAYKG